MAASPQQIERGKRERIEALESTVERHGRDISDTYAAHEGDIAELTQRVNTLEATVERLDADRKTFVRHAETTARNVRKLIAENRAFRQQVVAAMAAKAIRDHIEEPLRPIRDMAYKFKIPEGAEPIDIGLTNGTGLARAFK